MAKSRQGLRARVTQAAGRRRKKPTGRVESAFNDVKKLVRDAGDGLFGSSGRGAGPNKRVSAKKTATDRKRSGHQRQAATKKIGTARIRSGQQRQAAAKKAVRTRRAKGS
jgi:hypothetical protein